MLFAATRMRALFFASLIGSAAAPASADLSADEISLLKQSRGAQVLTSDGALVGETDGGAIKEDRARLFLRPVHGSIFRRLGKPVILTTSTDDIRLVDGAWVLKSDKQRVQIRANFILTDDAPITINLPQK